MDGEDVKKRDVMEKKVNSESVVESFLKRCGGYIVWNVGNIRFEDEDEDKDEIKELIWVNKNIANKRRKDWASVIMGLFRKKMFEVCVEEIKSLVG
ncbi:hypothetical protein Tco_0077640 [Tanacetum coccineum]